MSESDDYDGKDEAPYAPESGVERTWARTRPTPMPRSRVQFTRNDAEPLREVARQFRLREPRISRLVWHGDVCVCRRNS